MHSCVWDVGTLVTYVEVEVGGNGSLTNATLPILNHSAHVRNCVRLVWLLDGVPAARASPWDAQIVADFVLARKRLPE